MVYSSHQSFDYFCIFEVLCHPLIGVTSTWFKGPVGRNFFSLYLYLCFACTSEANGTENIFIK